MYVILIHAWKGTHQVAVQGEGSISNDNMRDLDSGPWKFSWWGQIEFVVEQHRPKLALFANATIALSSISSHVHHYEIVFVKDINEIHVISVVVVVVFLLWICTQV